MTDDLNANICLEVEVSLTGKRWIAPAAELERHATVITREAQLPQPVAMLLAQRGVLPEKATSFLNPTLRDLLPDPRNLRDMNKAAARILTATTTRQKIAIFADYDVDGGSSAALLIDWLRQLGHDATIYVPDRIDEGYGPNIPAMQELGAAHDLIICVDCGTLSHEPIAAADCDVVVLDHHLGGAELPECVAVVNPNRQDETGELGHLCAAAVVFLVLVEMNRELRKVHNKIGPDLMAMLDLVALATVADVAPLIGVNRAFVRQGLAVMARRARPGIVALCDVARLDRTPSAYHLGFVLGPRINAGGRIGEADLGTKLLCETEPHKVQAIATKLESLNTDRREIEAAVRNAAFAQAEARGLDAPLVWAANDGWHAGVVGIVASRLKEASNRPAIVIGFDGNAGKGSGRSVAGIDLGAAIQKLAAEGLIEKGGGHKMAAGLSLDRAQLEPAMARLSDLLARQGSGLTTHQDLRVDAVILPSGATPELIELLDQAGPFGASAPAPRFAFPNVKITFSKPVGETHLKFIATDGGPTKIEGIAFGAMEGPLGPALQDAQRSGRNIHIAGRLELNHWQGRSRVQIRLEDAAWADD
ncbi:single-stranded-DNA-specific exonuclease RecJ [Rhodobacterales bacterium LSUCC0246]|nr:single-stranded-DNA-specific exonuclease RecJ [Rhodobacterales bacterium LSUCC0374]